MDLSPEDLRDLARRSFAEARMAKDATERRALLLHMTALWERADRLERERALLPPPPAPPEPPAPRLLSSWTGLSPAR